MNKYQKHKEYMERKIDWETIRKIEIENMIVSCDKCGCIGDCDHEPLDLKKCCTLQDNMICPCCNIISDKGV